MSDINCSLADLLNEADLLCYEHPMRSVLRLRDAADVVYADEKDLTGIGMSRPEQKRLRATYHRMFPKGSFMGRLKKMLGKGETKKVEVIALDQEQHVISIERITLCRELGKGEFGSVYQAAWNNSGVGSERVQVAVKCVSAEKLLTSPNNFLQEAAIMHKMRHDCVVRMYGVVLDAKAVMLVSELAPCGSLLECLQNSALRESFFVDVLCDFAEQIASGMEYLSSQRLIHRDLAARNVLVFSADKVKISDFGLSRSLGMGEYYYRSEFSDSLKLPIAWCAPEAINFLKFTSASDVWSYGVTLFEMFSYGQMPWAGCTGAQILAAIDYPRHERLECPDACPADFYKLMLQCWAHKPEERPSFTDILSQLTDIMPQALITVCSCQDGVLDHLQFAKNEVIIVLDKCPPAYPDGYYWRGCIRSGRTGLFRPADTVARLGAETPGSKADHILSPLNAVVNDKQDKEKVKKKKLVISEPQGDVRHTCHVGIDGTSFGLLQVDKKELSRALPPAVTPSPNVHRRSPQIPTVSAPSTPSPSAPVASRSAEANKPDVVPRVAGCAATCASKPIVPPPLPSAPKPQRSFPTPSAPALSEPSSTCNTLTTSVPEIESTCDSVFSDEELLLALSRTKNTKPASVVNPGDENDGVSNKGLSWTADDSSCLIDEILREMNEDMTNFSLSTVSTSDSCSETRPLIGDTKGTPALRPASLGSQPICRVMSAAELERLEGKVDREHKKAERQLEVERRKEMVSWRMVSQKDQRATKSDATGKSFSSGISSTPAPPDWTEDAQNAYKLLVQCGDELSSPNLSPVQSGSSPSANLPAEANSQCAASSAIQQMKSDVERIERTSTVSEQEGIATTSGVSAKPSSGLICRSVSTDRAPTSTRQAVPAVPVKPNRVTFADDSSLSPLRQLRSSTGSVAHSFRARSVQPMEEQNGRLPPPVPPKPKSRAARSPEEEYPISRGGFASAVATSALFSSTTDDDVIKF